MSKKYLPIIKWPLVSLNLYKRFAIVGVFSFLFHFCHFCRFCRFCRFSRFSRFWLFCLSWLLLPAMTMNTKKLLYMNIYRNRHPKNKRHGKNIIFPSFYKFSVLPRVYIFFLIQDLFDQILKLSEYSKFFKKFTSFHHTFFQPLLLCNYAKFMSQPACICDTCIFIFIRRM